MIKILWSLLFLIIERIYLQPVKPDTTTSEPKRSKVEIFKEQSNFIRYPLNEELLTDAPNINEAATQLIKFHGSYQQANRDECGPKSYPFMLRIKHPCGKVSYKLYNLTSNIGRP